MKPSRILVTFFLAAMISLSCLIPQEMVGYILPSTLTITATETLTPPPSLTPFQPITLTPLPAEIASPTLTLKLIPSGSPTFTAPSTLTILPSLTASKTSTIWIIPILTQTYQSSQTATTYLIPTSTKSKTPTKLTSTKTQTGPTATASLTRTPGPTFTRTFTRTPGPTLTASPTYNGNQVTPSGPVTASQLINAMNQLRVANGYPALRVNSILNGTAQWTAAYMAANHLNGHIGNVSGRIAAAGYGNGATVFATENWARGFTTLPQIMAAWSDSLHMIPATNQYLTDIGAGVATGPWGPYYILHAAYSVGPTVAPSPTRTRTRTPTRTQTPTFTVTPVPPTNTPVPTEVPSDTPIPTEIPSDTPQPSETPTTTGSIEQPGMMAVLDFLERISPSLWPGFANNLCEYNTGMKFCALVSFKYETIPPERSFSFWRPA